MTKLNSQSGMTLLEVMVALAIFALAGTAIMGATGDHLRSLGQLEEITFATWVANNRLTQVNLDNQWPVKSNQRGQQEMAGRTWYWRQNTLKTNDKDLVAVEVTIGTRGDYSDTITTVSTYIANPDPNLGGAQ